MNRYFIILFLLFTSLSYAAPISKVKHSEDVYKSEVPVIMSYWTNWNLYLIDSKRAIPRLPYPVPGSFTINNHQKQKETNADFNAKLQGLNIIIYAFLQAQTKRYQYHDGESGTIKTVPNPDYEKTGGTLYFSDPWVDLGGSDAFCNDIHNSICWFTYHMQNIHPDNHIGLANFNAFIALQHSQKNRLGPLRKMISIGGPDRDATFEETFDSEQRIHNFVTSAARLIKAFYNRGRGLAGIDLDYENPNMTHEQSVQYANLVAALRTTLNKEIGVGRYLLTISILSDPGYILGTSGNNTSGFTRDSLQRIAQNVDYIAVNTFNFSGPFNYQPNGVGRTGFIINLYTEQHQPHSIQRTLSALKQVVGKRIPNKRIIVSLPAFGYALDNIPEKNHGLFQRIPADSKILKGNIDMQHCRQSLPATHDACSGAFSYQYLMNRMINKGFKPKLWTQNGVYNGATAYAAHWKAQPETDAKKPQEILYNNVFLSFCAPELAASITQYVIKNNYGGIMLWEMNGDMPFNTGKSSLSLLGTVVKTYESSAAIPFHKK